MDYLAFIFDGWISYNPSVVTTSKIFIKGIQPQHYLFDDVFAVGGGTDSRL